MSSIRYLGGCDATYVSERELMLVESLVKATVELQGFRVESVTGATSGLVAVVVADLRFSPRCGQCLEPARLSGHASGSAVSPCADVGDPGGASLRAAAGELSAVRGCPCGSDAVGQRQAAYDPGAGGDAGDVDATVALGAGGATISLRLGDGSHRGSRRRLSTGLRIATSRV